MSLLSTLEKQLGDLRAKRERQAKLVADLTAPQIELDRLQQQEAEAERAYQARRAELEQLRVERAELDRQATCVPSTAAETKAAIKVLEAHERAYGGRTNVFARALYELRESTAGRERAAELRDQADVRIKELEG
jgi:hypothetical protein